MEPLAPIPVAPPVDRRRGALIGVGVFVGVAGLSIALVSLLAAQVELGSGALVGGLLGLGMAALAASRRLKAASVLAVVGFGIVPAAAAYPMGSMAALLLTWVPVYPLLVHYAAGAKWGRITAALVAFELVLFAVLFPDPVVLASMELPVPVLLASGLALTGLCAMLPSLTASIEIELEKLNRELDERVRARTQEVLDQKARILRGQRLEAIGQMAGSVAHDFNNMLTVTTYAAQELRGLVPEEAVPALDDIDAATKQAIGLTRELLAFSKRGPTRRTHVDTVAALRTAGELVRRLLPKGSELVLELDPRTGDLFFDPTGLERLLMNLVVNAAHAGADKVVVSSQNVGSMVQIDVRDDGGGMSPEVLESACEPFFSTKPIGHGTGLGLSTVAAIVAQGDGTLEIESTVGEGTVVRVLIPCAVDVELASPTGLTVLLVEDDDDVREALTMALARRGYGVKSCSAADDAMTVLRSDAAIDLLVTDWLMPDGDGSWLLRRAAEARPGLPALVVTGWPEDGQPPGTLLKPIRPSEFVDRVGVILSG